MKVVVRIATQDMNVPSNDDLLGINLVMQLIHRMMILHVYCNLLGSLTVQHSERGPNFDLASVRARSKQRPNDPLLCISPSEVVVEDGEQGYGMYSNRCRCPSN